MKSKFRKLELRYIIGIIVVLGVFLVVLMYKYEHTFSKDRWVKYPRERVKMIDNMLKKYNLVGQSKEQIIEFLGEETQNAYFKEENNLVYYLGDERGVISIDSEWLILRLTNNIVTEVEITTD